MRFGFLALTTCTLFATSCLAADLLQFGDPILAIDIDPAMSTSDYPPNEGPFNAIDGDSATKYLNFGRTGSGFIITPSIGSTQARSMLFRTANDFPERDPAAWILYGTNDAIVSADNSDGRAENWTLIGSDSVTLPDERFTDGPLISFSNGNLYSSYKLIFPDLKNAGNANSMQIADVFMYESMDGSGNTIFTDFIDPIFAVDEPGPTSAYPAAESPGNLLDGDTATKYLNFGRENSGFIVTPSAGSTIVDSFQISTANDSESRDPSSWELYGTNEAIMSTDNSFGDLENWTLIDAGNVALPTDRFTAGDVVTVNNTEAYSSYRMIFPSVRDPLAGDADSMQISEIQFFGEIVGGGINGDFNNDGNYDCADIDALVGAIASQGNDPAFDLTSDGLVNGDDLNAWLVEGGANNPDDTGGNPFLAGDANLDGTVDGSDFLVWNTNKFTAQAAWCNGDLNADGNVDGGDFLVWNTNKFMSSDVTAVPEPATGILALISLLAVASLRRIE